VRVIGGALRGRKLVSPPGEETRPTADRVRESLFNIIATRISGARFLDAFAGTGAVGIEALSRGAERAVFVESSRAAARTVAANLDALGLGERSRLVARPFVKAVELLRREEAPFDLAYLDPPYAPGELLRALRLLAAPGFLAPGALVIAEHELKLAMPEQEGDLRLARSVKYGRTVLTLFEPC